MTILRHASAIAIKDLRSEFRTKEALNGALSFSIVILLMIAFAFDTGAELVSDYGGGILWLAFTFASALIVNRSFARELPNDCIDVLVSSPASGAALFLGKSIASFLLLVVIESICLPVFGVFFNVTWWRNPSQLALVVLLGSWAMACMGTVFSALTINLRLREVMLPMLMYPMLIPAVLSAMTLTNYLMQPGPLPPDYAQWMRMLVGFDIIFTTLALALVETILVR
ncbi:MAG: heme ABC transporter permease CcmB [Acidobacteria bacterium]|nr:heme ABC transporter permease CcmB [Acidobacteriota bacterium]